ncbi:MAG TPA: ABC transporter substrate-binding protein [Methylomirabilota bacterium]
MDRRRFLLIVLASPLALPLVANAQETGTLWRIGYLDEGSAARSGPYLDAFRQKLRDLGWIEGRDIAIEYRWAEGRLRRLIDLAAELVRLDVDVIVSPGTPGPMAARHVTRTTPIVMMGTDDPVASGLAASLTRPGGNVTGLSLMAPELGGKQLQLLDQMVAGLARVGVLWNSHALYPRLVVREIQAAAPPLGIQLESLELRGPEDFERAFEAAMLKQVGALITVEDPLVVRHRARIVDFAAQSRLPAIYGLREFVDAGGLLMYGADRRDLFRRSAIHVDRILKGAKPADLAIEPPAKFELVVNLKTARAHGLTIPPSLLARADQLIE